jgi:hypothetical protein
MSRRTTTTTTTTTSVPVAIEVVAPLVVDEELITRTKYKAEMEANAVIELARERQREELRLAKRVADAEIETQMAIRRAGVERERSAAAQERVEWRLKHPDRAAELDDVDARECEMRVREAEAKAKVEAVIAKGRLELETVQNEEAMRLRIATVKIALGAAVGALIAWINA